jgi:hypothetical protein
MGRQSFHSSRWENHGVAPTEANLFESAKKIGRAGLRKTKGLLTNSETKFWTNLPSTLTKNFEAAFLADTSAHVAHVEEMEDNLRAEINTYKSAQTALEKMEKRFDAQTKAFNGMPDSDDPKSQKLKASAKKKKEKLEREVKSSKAKLAGIASKLRDLVNSNMVERASAMFTDSVKLGNETVDERLVEVSQAVDTLKTTTLATQKKLREEAAKTAAGGLEALIAQVNSLLAA